LLAEQFPQQAVALQQPLHAVDVRLQLLVVGNDPLRHPQSGQQGHGIEWLDQIVVGSGVQPGDDIRLLRFGAEQQDVGAAGDFASAELLADLGAVEPGHDPVEDGQVGGRGRFQDLHRRQTFLDDFDLVTHLGQQSQQQPPDQRVIVGDENLHAVDASRPAGGAG
jgi:hypothetical protein